jgi:malonyl-CoA O-methyltransferase
MTTMINKSLKRMIFDRAATTYDEYAVLQHQIIDNLIDRLQFVKFDPKLIIDLGSGTSRAGQLLQSKYKKTKIINLDFSEKMLLQGQAKNKNFLQWVRRKEDMFICSDFEQLPFAKNSFDMVWSSSSIQWASDIEQLLKEVLKALKPGGLFIMSTFGPETLFELNQISKQIFNKSTTSHFIDMHELGDLLLNLGFQNPVLDRENFVMTYQHPSDLFKDLKKIGATNGNMDDFKGMKGRGYLEKIIHEYSNYKKDNLYPASYEVIYAHAWKPNNADNLKPINFVK